MYPKKLGILTPDFSAMLLTMKLGPFPMYVIAPMKTAPKDMATRLAVLINEPSARRSAPSAFSGVIA